jgi:signal transduction histidine kinase
MDGADRRQLEERVLILAPTAKDAALSRSILAEAALACTLCPDLPGLCRELAAGAGAVVVTEAALAAEPDCLAEALRQQPPWSDLPVVVLAAGGADSPEAVRALETLGNVTLLELPVRVATLVSTLRAALRARRRQYQSRAHLAERERVAEELKDAAHRKDEFLAMLAHELRNPLAPVRNALHLMRRQFAGDAVLAQTGTMMERQVAHLVRLVDDLLDVSRITRDKIELRKEPLDLRAVVSRVVESVRPALDERGHHLEVALPAEPVWVDADPARLEQVLENLLSNAGKYTPPGGHIRCAAGREGGEAVIRVQDDGIGIRPEMQARVFDLFQQADRVPGRVSEGLGLGLTLVRRLVQLHGGTVVVHSAGPGRGSQFVVRLPLAAEAVGRAKESAPSPAPARGRPLRILVVDDNVDGAKTLAALLRLEGHEVQVAHDGPAALEAAAAFRPETVLLDIGLPKGMDGYEVARRLQELPVARQTFLVALTGFGQEEDRLRSRAAGFRDHLVKPVDPEVLRGVLARAQGC